jgi:glucose-6-phosphate 1-dehydrogenase
VPETLLILGASGDLTARLLLPGLGGLLARGFGSGIELLGSGAEAREDERWRARVAEAFASAGADGEEAAAVASGARYLQADVTTDHDLRALLKACEGRPIVYFALPPSITAAAFEAMTGIG